MPKEIVYALPQTDGQGPDKPPPRVHVGWSRQEAGGYVQLATLPSEAAELGILPGAQGSPHQQHTGWQFVDLDRAMINDLIRNLRRARDQAFGRDE